MRIFAGDMSVMRQGIREARDGSWDAQGIAG
jgi:hypothetical protein